MVLWMLSLMATIMAEVAGLVCRIYTLAVAEVELIRVLGGVMLLVALLAGVVTLGMIPIAWRLANTKPPRSMVVFASVAGAVPMIAVILQLVTRR
jgi:hypothetical protein